MKKLLFSILALSIFSLTYSQRSPEQLAEKFITALQSQDAELIVSLGITLEDFKTMAGDELADIPEKTMKAEFARYQESLRMFFSLLLEHAKTNSIDVSQINYKSSKSALLDYGEESPNEKKITSLEISYDYKGKEGIIGVIIAPLGAHYSILNIPSSKSIFDAVKD